MDMSGLGGKERRLRAGGGGGRREKKLLEGNLTAAPFRHVLEPQAAAGRCCSRVGIPGGETHLPLCPATATCVPMPGRHRAPPRPPLNSPIKHAVYLEKGKQRKGENSPSQLLVPNVQLFCESKEEGPQGCRRAPPHPRHRAQPPLSLNSLSRAQMREELGGQGRDTGRASPGRWLGLLFLPIQGPPAPSSKGEGKGSCSGREIQLAWGWGARWGPGTAVADTPLSLDRHLPSVTQTWTHIHVFARKRS